MGKTFIPRLNEFTEMLKDVNKQHANNIVSVGEQLKHLNHSIEIMKTELKAVKIFQKINNKEKELTDPYEKLEENIKIFEQHIKAYRSIFQNHISDTNQMLGRISGHWGGYVEQVGVEYILNLLRENYGVHTWYQKFKRYWHKSKNVELDLVALSDTHAYIVEVKNQLRPEIINQILSSQDKIKEHLPELEKLQKQSVVMCVHANDEIIINMLKCANVWILKYIGFDNDKQTKVAWEWIQ